MQERIRRPSRHDWSGLPYREQPPEPGYALQLVLASVLEPEAGTGDHVRDGPRDHYPVADGAAAADGTGGPVDGREEAVAHRLDLAGSTPETSTCLCVG